MKAREIIPHWPRGRSTSSRRRWLELEPFTHDYVYHRDQQAMVTRYIEALHRGGILSAEFHASCRIWADHDFKEVYYGHECSKCGVFFALGCAPWDS